MPIEYFLFTECKENNHSKCKCWEAGYIDGILTAAAKQCTCKCHIKGVGDFPSQAAKEIMTLEERVEFLQRSIESHDNQIGILTENLDIYTKHSYEDVQHLKIAILKLTDVVVRLNTYMINHEHRINIVEDKINLKGDQD